MEQYIASFPFKTQAVLKLVRKTILDAVPGAQEVISYNIPAVKSNGWLFYYSAYASHFSLSCPPPWSAFTNFEARFAPYKMSKSTIQFPLDEPVPTELIAGMARFRAELNAKATSKASKPAK